MSPLPALGSFAYPGDSGSFESISTVTVGAGGSSSITFSSIPSTYKHLQIRFLSADQRSSFADSPLLMRFNSDTAANYSYHELGGDGSTAQAYGTAGASSIWAYNGGALAFGAGVIDVLDYQNTNKYKTSRAFCGDDVNGAGGWIRLASGNWRNTAVVSTITFNPFSGNFRQYSSFALYGIKG